MPINKLEAARDYVKRGFSVIPVGENKKPIIKWSQYQTKRPTDEELIKWFGGNSQNNIAIVTGKISGISVVDIDSLAASLLAEYKGLHQKSPLVKTGRCKPFLQKDALSVGYHLYYKYEEGVRNFQKRDDLPGIDLRGDGGYVVAPPSIHESGKQYVWVKGFGLDDLLLADLPGWVLGREKKPIEELLKGVPEGARNQGLARLAGHWFYEGTSFNDCLIKAKEWNLQNKPPLSEDEIERTVKSISERHQKSAVKYFTEKAFNPDSLAKEIVAENNFLFKSKDGFYQYHPSGVWEKIDNELIKRLVDMKLGGKSKKSRIHDALELISIKAYAALELNHKRNLLNLRNGMFDITAYEILPHNKEYFSTIQLDVKYNPGALCASWLAFLDDVLAGDRTLKQIIQEFFGYCLVPDTRYEKMLILIGDGANGKSTLIAVLSALLGKENISSISLANIEKEFHRVALYRKLINISTEFESKEILTSGYLKSIISGDPIDACYKFKDTFTFTPFARLIVAMNELPRVRDRSYGFYRRLLIVPFNKRFEGEKADRRLKHKLIEELDGIFLWALEGLKRLYANDTFTESKTVTELVTTYRKDNNPVEVFLDEKCKMDFKAKTKKSELYDSYKNFCELNGFRSQNNVHFSRDLKRLIPNLSETQSSGGVRYWIGVNLVDETRTPQVNL